MNIYIGYIIFQYIYIYSRRCFSKPALAHRIGASFGGHRWHWRSEGEQRRIFNCCCSFRGLHLITYKFGQAAVILHRISWHHLQQGHVTVQRSRLQTKSFEDSGSMILVVVTKRCFAAIAFGKIF